MAGGYMGKILMVDLSKGTLQDEPIDEATARDYIGGYGYGAKLIYERTAPGVDPLGSDNILGIMTGPLTGTPALTGNRYTVMGKSPLTGGWADANSGGDFGPKLKFAGYDGVFVKGASSKPVYLLINEGKAELRDASKLWGKDSVETEDALQAELGADVGVACIGPAGESLSLIAAVMNNDGRAAGRSGVGAIMGSKKLKAIAVKGKMKVPVTDEESLKTIRQKYMEAMKSPNLDGLKKYGTAGGTADCVTSGDGPVKNWGGSAIDFPNSSLISDEAVIASLVKSYGCWRCPIQCGGIVKIRSGPYAIEEGHKSEYETLAAFGSMCLNENVESIHKCNDICNRAGLDTISTGGVVAFAIECYKNGKITKADTDGLELKWGNHAAIVALTEKIAKREGLGAILADGVKKASEKIGKGTDKFAMQIGGQELPMHDPKCLSGLGPTYVMDATPARHTKGTEEWPAAGVVTKTYKFNEYKGRAKEHQGITQWMHTVDASGVCQFPGEHIPATWIGEFLTAITGWKIDLAETIKIGERIGALRQVYNVREGVNFLSYKIPGRIFGEPPLKEGNLAGITVPIKEMIRENMDVLDWDPKTGIPSEKKLKELGLDFLIKDVKVMQNASVPA